jgi:hypothetical protein
MGLTLTGSFHTQLRLGALNSRQTLFRALLRPALESVPNQARSSLLFLFGFAQGCVGALSRTHPIPREIASFFCITLFFLS